MTALHLTIDFEDPTEVYAPEGRYLTMVRRVLDFCDAHAVKATFFTVGRIAVEAPDIIREIADRGHEIAYHSHAHVPLTDDHPEVFFREAYVDKARLEELSGKAVLGFRAPCYSLTTETLWAIDKLGKLGFTYSSSIMPTGFSRFGVAKAPRQPFLWPNGMVEFPLPVVACGPLRFAYLGGIYLYALPFFLAKRWAQKAPPENVLWTYAHPYDFDREESFVLMPHTPAWVSLVLWLARRRAEPQLDRLLNAFETARPLGLLATDPTVTSKLKVFTPSKKA